METSWGFHLILVTDQREEKKLTFEEARNSAYQFLREIQLQRLTAELAAQLRQEAQVKIFL